VTWSWDFGDGATSTAESPVHVYNRSGRFSVTRTATTWSGESNTTTKWGCIVVAEAPTADFTVNVTSGAAPLTVGFTANTTGASAWEWRFGDGGSSTDRDPIHCYAHAGIYDVTLIASNPIYGGTIAIRHGYIRITEAPMVDFSANVTNGTTPLTVAFSGHASGAPFHWSWSFGDGGQASGQNPTHTYTTPGIYTVALTVHSVNGSTTETKTAFVITTGTTIPVPTPDPRAPVANFTMSRTSGQAPLLVRFVDTSAGSPTSWRWTFDTIWTLSRNPAVVFRQAGTYPVTLTASNAFGSSTKTAAIVVSGAGMKGAEIRIVE
jgi:PKD repeat protein